ncbi:MAG: hypothetical protein GDA52_02810 [Rhodobacteraceae bacterium]|nr:hypothetical protein [Paracoccaceae bacterium]
MDSGLKIGDTLEYANDQSVTAEVISDRKVRLNGKAMTLTAAASELLQKEGYTWKTVPGPRYWLFEGETIAERRKRLSEEMDRKQEEDEWEGH